MPVLSTLFSASVNENFINVHICTPNLNPAVEPDDEAVCIELVSDLTLLLSEEEADEGDPLQDEMQMMNRTGNKMAANRFMYLLFVDDICWGWQVRIFNVKKLGF
jgi:hypothetical protein